MKKTALECKDGSWTYHNHEIGEAYHTPLGAAMESREKYAAAVDLKEKAKKGSIIILDVCYGLGYNSAAAIEKIVEYNPNCVIKVIGLEIDKDIIIEAMNIPFAFENKEIFEELSKEYDEEKKSFTYSKKNIIIEVLIGDAKERILEIKEKVDVIFFDAFSPKKQPEMWTKEFFTDIFDTCANKAILVTYSCARKVRDDLTSAGFNVSDGPVVGRRGPATIGKVIID